MNRAVRRSLKFLHTLGAVGLMGGMAALALALVVAPGVDGGAGSVLLMQAMAKIAAWLLMPSMTLTVTAGLLAIAVNPALHEAGWAWAKAATGILIFEGALHVIGPIQEAAKRGAGVLDSAGDPAALARLVASERNTLWVLLAVSAANIAVGIWRPRLGSGSA